MNQQESVSLVTAVVAFLLVFVAAWMVLEWLWPVPPSRPRRRPKRPSSLAVVPVFWASDLLTEALGWLLVVWSVAIGLLALLALVYWLGPKLKRRWPRLAAWCWGCLPLPCTHRDLDGVSLMYRDRREVEGRSIPYWVCWACGHAEPIIDRPLEDVDRFAAIRPAHEAMKATPKAPPPSVLKFAARGKR